MDVNKPQRVPAFHNFGKMRLFGNLIICLIIGFLNKYPPKFVSILSYIGGGGSKNNGNFEFLTLYRNYFAF